ncbi:DNA ligase [Paenibacillus chitinolyticus]|uniref:ATP-dependent DNA ligase n=1 Tax=Paenibacillus chitinolyticus TaxID=79263 RepID=UPI002DB800B0|nr:DNA ligase [Paenibacillus chitinolyticus]MEC0246445.1 DNA ligase [Paenibacillus chitinolyticus]
MQPFLPMSPILTNTLPEGDEWMYQLKWDGFRILAFVDNGKVELFSKKMLSKNRNYPDLIEALEKLTGTFVLDGEAVILDPATGRPSFQKMQQRDKLTDPALIRRAVAREPVHYMLFDVLQIGEEDLRGIPFKERFRRLEELAAGWKPPLYRTDLYGDAGTLWEWVTANEWEGVIAKRAGSLYREGKEHKDWFKRKRAVRHEVQAVGFLLKEGRLASLVMSREGRYFGRVSSGLNERVKRELRGLKTGRIIEDYFMGTPEGLRSAEVLWLEQPLTILVTGREVTESGLLRHPKLLALEGMTL